MEPTELSLDVMFANTVERCVNCEICSLYSEQQRQQSNSLLYTSPHVNALNWSPINHDHNNIMGKFGTTSDGEMRVVDVDVRYAIIKDSLKLLKRVFSKTGGWVFVLMAIPFEGPLISNVLLSWDNWAKYDPSTITKMATIQIIYLGYITTIICYVQVAQHT